MNTLKPQTLPWAMGLLLASSLGCAHAQSPAPALPTAAQTDPVALGWMVGSPPPANKVIQFYDGSFYKFPQFRWSFSNYRQLAPTTTVSRGAGAATALPRAERKDLDEVTFTPWARPRP